MQQSLALFFIVITGKVYALSLMHTINSRQAMRERFKSLDHGRTSLSQFQWSDSRILIGSDDPSITDVSGLTLEPLERIRSSILISTAPIQPNTVTGMSSGLNQDLPRIRRTASGVTNNIHKQATSPPSAGVEHPLCVVTVNSRLPTVDVPEDAIQHQRTLPADV